MTCFNAVPWPTTVDAFCSGDVAKISPKSDLDLLNPVVPAFAMLLDVTESCVVAALSPVSEVKNDIVNLLLDQFDYLMSYLADYPQCETPARWV